MFLIDCVGAVVSATMLGVVLASFSHLIGMPANALYILSSIAFVFATYSFLGHRGVFAKQNKALKAISIANLLYCALTICLMVYFQESITWLGVAYFVGEKAIVVPLAVLEWRISTKPL